MSKKILVFDDHPAILSAFESWGRKTVEYEVIAIEQKTLEIEEHIKLHEPHIVVLDLSFGGNLTGFHFAKAIRKIDTNQKIILYTMWKERNCVQLMAKLKLNGYVCKTEPMENLKTIFDQVSEGKVYYSHDIEHLLSEQDDKQPLEILTDREKQVLQIVIKDHSNKEIADHLGISPLTVKKHIENIRIKLNCEGKRELKRYVREHAILDELNLLV